MAEEKVDEKAALKKVAKERGVSKSEAYRELQRSKLGSSSFIHEKLCGFHELIRARQGQL